MINIVDFNRIAYFLHKNRVPLLPNIIYFMQFIIFNSSVPPSVVIGKGTRFAYGGIGVVIHADCIIGENCIIGQGVTLGGDGNRQGVPRLGDSVYIGAGARLLGPIFIDNSAKIGANAVVLCDVPSNMTAVGVPARCI